MGITVIDLGTCDLNMLMPKSKLSFNLKQQYFLISIIIIVLLQELLTVIYIVSIKTMTIYSLKRIL